MSLKLSGTSSVVSSLMPHSSIVSAMIVFVFMSGTSSVVSSLMPHSSIVSAMIVFMFMFRCVHYESSDINEAFT